MSHYSEEREACYAKEVTEMWKTFAHEREAPSAGCGTRDIHLVKAPDKGDETLTWPTEERIDSIAQNGATGEHYKDELQTMIDSSEAIQETKDRMEAEDNARAKRREPEVLGTYQRVLTQPIIVGGTGDNLYDVIIDVYDVLDAYPSGCPPLDHAVKKLLCAGGRGFKDWETDLQEAIDSLERAKSFPPTPF